MGKFFARPGTSVAVLALVAVSLTAIAVAWHFKGGDMAARFAPTGIPEARSESLVEQLRVSIKDRDAAELILLAKGLDPRAFSLVSSGKSGILIAYREPTPVYIILSAGLVLNQKPVLASADEAESLDLAIGFAALDWKANRSGYVSGKMPESDENEDREDLKSQTHALGDALGSSLDNFVTDLHLAAQPFEASAETTAEAHDTAPAQSPYIDYGTTKIRKIGFSDEGAPLPHAGYKAQAKALFNKLKPSFPGWTVTYPAIGPEKREIIVFTDWTCPYCRKFHSNLEKINRQGVAVHYMMFPRMLAQGRDAAADVLSGFRGAWCAPDVRLAIDDLFAGLPLDEVGEECSHEGRSDFPAEEHFVMGLIFGIEGTPMIIDQNGGRATGFSSVQKMLTELDK